MLWNSARAIGSFAADWPGVKGMGRYFDRLYRMRGLGRDDVEPPRKKSVAEGTDSPSYAERGVSYLREKVGFGHQLPQQGEVLHNLFGERPDEDDEARLSAYDGAIAEERKRDTALRIFIENIIHDWMSDPKSRGEFVHMWGAAKNDAEKARALFDPKGDGSYLKYLAELVAGLQSGENPELAMEKWQKVADWSANNLGSDTLIAIGDEAVLIARSRGLPPETRISDSGKYMNKLINKGYTKKEAETLASAFETEEEAEHVIRNLRGQQNQSSIEQHKAQMREASDERNWEINKGQIERLEKERADIFLRDFSQFAIGRYGMELSGYSLGEIPDGVKDVPTAVKWAYDRLGRNVFLPAEEELPPKPPPQSATGGGLGRRVAGGGGRPALPPAVVAARTTQFRPLVSNVLAGKGYSTDEFGALENSLNLSKQFAESGVPVDAASLSNLESKFPNRNGFADWFAGANGFENLAAVAGVLNSDSNAVLTVTEGGIRGGSIQDIISDITKAKTLSAPAP